MPDEQPTATFLMSDIEGSTRLWEQVPETMQAALARHDAVMKASVEQHRGRVVKGTGDGILAVFERPEDGVAAALTLQLALLDPAATDGLPLYVRCGLHAGPYVRRDDDYFGPTLNRAARVMSVAHGGQTLLSHAVVERIGDRLPPRAETRDLGRVRLRDLATPERVYQLVHPDLRDVFPPLRSLEATPNNLAQQLNSFVGRERELSEIRQKLASSRLLTLLGVGGIGKSRLSVQVAAEVMDDYPDGVWLVELAPLGDARLVPQALASVIGVKEEPGLPMTESLGKYVRDKQVLLVLDNCEHVLTACAELAKQLLQASATVKLLASSRDVLQIAGETIYHVPTLTVPSTQQLVEPDELMRHEAVRLFVDRAAAVQPAFQFTKANAPKVAEICRRLDGIPLAIELAAARTRALSVDAIATRLNDRFKLLVSNDQTVLPRQRTLRALIDWSYDLLPQAEQTLLRRLAVFVGGWTLDAAEAVCGAHGLDAADVLDLLGNLVQKSLVVMDLRAERYRMLDTVRHYALEKLQETDDADASRDQHLAFFVGCAEAARPELAGPNQGEWLARLDPERENFLAAHAWSEHTNGGDDLALRLVHSLRPYWINRGDLTIGHRLAVDTVARRGLQQRNAARCMALFGAGYMSYLMGHNNDAHQFLAECLAIARETDNSQIVARVLQPLGLTRLAEREFGAAGRYLDEAVKLARELGDQREVASALNALAMLHRMQAELESAAALSDQAIQVFRELDDKESIGIGLLNLAMVLIQQGAHGRARDMLLEIADLAESTGSQPICQSALEVCAGLAAALADWHGAARMYGAAERQREEGGLRREPADAAFLTPLITLARDAQPAQSFDEHESQGRGVARDEVVVELRRWLAGVPGQR